MARAALLVLGAGLLLLAGGGAAASALASPALEADEAPLPGVTDEIGAWVDQAQAELSGEADPTMNAQSNVAAALEAIRQSEGTASQSDPYAVCFGYRHTISDFSDHPALTGEWLGEPLPDHICAGAGLGSGCVSTAAGAYQIKKSTWQAVRGRLNLPDFSPASQDAAAVELLRLRGALVLIQQGKFAQGIAAARKEWASLPGAGYGQGERSIEWLTARYTAAGGALA